MRVAAANYPITYHRSIGEWKSFVGSWISKLENVDIAVFPEYGSMELVSLLEKTLQKDARAQVRALQVYVGEFKELYTDLAKKHDVIIVAPSFPLEQGGKIINRAFVFSDKGEVGYQDKLFMTPFENNEWGVSAGEPELTLFNTDKGSFGIQICYDSEFPIGSFELAKAGADIILVPSCTETIRGATRVHVASRARAMENQCYTIVSQTIGEALWTPAVDYNYGYCAAYSTPDIGFPELGILQESEHQNPLWLVQDFDLSLLSEVREKGGVLNYRDSQQLLMEVQSERLKVKRIEV